MDIQDFKQRVFTDRTPLGPIVTPTKMRQEHFKLIFETENKLVDELSNDAQLFIGRRGSGKTMFLKAVQFLHPKALVIDLISKEAFMAINAAIDDLTSAKKSFFIEHISQLWCNIFWIGIMIRISSLEDENRKKFSINQTLNYLGIKPTTGLGTLFKILLSAVEIKGKIGEHFEISIKGEKISEALNQLAENASIFELAKDQALSIITERNLAVYILIDTLEDYQLDTTSTSTSIAGLLKSINEFSDPIAQISARVCMPAELYHVFRENSSNPSKDFDQHQLLHWHAAELLQICAARFHHYLEVTEPLIAKRVARNYDLTRRQDVIRFWREFLPDTVTNGFAIKEDPLAYILRHTQLLPRHIIQLMNEIIKLNVRRYKNSREKISEGAIKAGVANIEGIICQEIFSAYKYVHPLAEILVDRSLPYLPYSFNYGELHKVFNRRGKLTGVEIKFESFLRTLVEIGVIGRIERETDRYTIGRFDYTVPNRLTITSENNLCIHPLFVKRFNSLINQSKKPIYPYGTAFDEEDYRDKL